MRIFGNADDLPEEIEVKINALIKKIEQIDYLGEISMYYGYPFIELDGKETIMKSCIICSKGIISIYADEQEMKVYQRHLTKMLMESSELSNLLWGNAPDKMYHSRTIMGATEGRIGALVAGQPVYIRVDTFNENGITEGKIIKVRG